MKILFMCVANSARSQLAEGLARRLFPEADIMSAGSHPGKLNPFAVQVMAEIGLDISSHYAKAASSLPSERLADLDYIITLCAEEICPAIPGGRAKKFHWPFPDPAHSALSDDDALRRFRETRDSINDRLKSFALEIKLEIKND